MGSGCTCRRLGSFAGTCICFPPDVPTFTWYYRELDTCVSLRIVNVNLLFCLVAATTRPISCSLATMSSRMLRSGRAMSSRVQDGEQSVETATTAAAQPARPVLCEDALFLFIAEGRRPNGTELLVLFLGLAASVSFQRHTGSQVAMR